VQIIELLIFAALAGAVLYQLYAVLGRRVGKNADDVIVVPSQGPAGIVNIPRAPEDSPVFAGLVALRASDPTFDQQKFLEGAKGAYETIVRAFANSDRDTLARLVTPEVFVSFTRVIDGREAEGRSEILDFKTPPRADLENLEAAEGFARAKVRFLAEFRSRSKGPEGEAVEDRRTAEFWTFERPLSSRDPNWLLSRVDAAES
jgi:predicted lipid-binding transport protein (Tim44 family)